MNNDQFKGQWNQFKGKIKEKWGKLTDDDMRQIDGKRDQLLGKLQSRYGFEKQRAEDELSRFEQTFSFDEEMECSGTAPGMKGAPHCAPGSNSKFSNGFGKNPGSKCGDERNMRGGGQERPRH